jgi:alpha-1,2-mannosyltransferase
MYVVYPLISYNAARGLTSTADLFSGLARRLRLPSPVARFFPDLFQASIIMVFVVLSLGRILAQLRAYCAPMHVYGNIAGPGFVCLGKEWHRFPSSFFVPAGSRPALIKSAFDGLLPGSFDDSDDPSWRSGIWRIPPEMNDQNLPEPTHMVDPAMDSTHHRSRSISATTL